MNFTISNLMEKVAKTVYYYRIKEMDLDSFKQEATFYRFFEIYQKIFLTKASMLLNGSDYGEILNVQNCGCKFLNSKITGHVINAGKKLGSKLTPDQFSNFFRITWSAKVKIATPKELEKHCGKLHELQSCKNIGKIAWRYPIFHEIKDHKGCSGFSIQKWSTFFIFFDLDELNIRKKTSNFAHQARITVSKTHASIELGCTFE